jgi:hypothetical protein
MVISIGGLLVDSPHGIAIHLATTAIIEDIKPNVPRVDDEF